MFSLDAEKGWPQVIAIHVPAKNFGLLVEKNSYRLVVTDPITVRAERLVGKSLMGEDRWERVSEDCCRDIMACILRDKIAADMKHLSRRA